jgi:hypothetical protein
MSNVAWMKTSVLIGSSTALWLASMTPAWPMPIQGLCLGGALMSCGFAVMESKRGIRGAAAARIREGLNFEALKQEMAIAASSLEQSLKARYFPNDVEDPLTPRQQLEQTFQNSPGAVQVGPELVRAVRLLEGAGFTREKVAQELLGSMGSAADVEQILKLGEQQGW